MNPNQDRQKGQAGAADNGSPQQQQASGDGRQPGAGTEPESSSVGSQLGHARVTPGGGQSAQHSQSARGAGQFGDDQGGEQLAREQRARTEAHSSRQPQQQQQSSSQRPGQDGQQSQQQQQQQQQPPRQQNLQEAVREAQRQKSGAPASPQHQQSSGGTLQQGSNGPQNPAVSGSHQTLQPHSSGHDQPGKSAGRTNSNDDTGNGPHRGG